LDSCLVDDEGPETAARDVEIRVDAFVISGISAASASALVRGSANGACGSICVTAKTEYPARFVQSLRCLGVKLDSDLLSPLVAVPFQDMF